MVTGWFGEATPSTWVGQIAAFAHLPVQLPQHRQHLLERSAVGRRKQPRRGEPGLDEYRLLVGEGEERGLAVICADARRADSTERQILVREMPQRVVDGDTTRNRLGQHLACAHPVA